MAWVVFLRGANVGAHNRFQPKALSTELADLDVVNIGAAGTFVVRAKVTAPQLRARILKCLEFEPDVMIRPAKELLALTEREPFKDDGVDADTRAFVTIMSKEPVRSPTLPLFAPDKANWEVQVLRVAGAAVLSLWRRRGKNVLYPNEVVEKALKVSGTTRGWGTIEKIVKVLDEREKSRR